MALEEWGLWGLALRLAAYLYRINHHCLDESVVFTLLVLMIGRYLFCQPNPNQKHFDSVNRCVRYRFARLYFDPVVSDSKLIFVCFLRTLVVG